MLKNYSRSNFETLPVIDCVQEIRGSYFSVLNKRSAIFYTSVHVQFKTVNTVID